MYELVKRFEREEDGATAIEYGLIVSLIFLAMVAAAKFFAAETIEMFDYITESVREAVSG